MELLQLRYFKEAAETENFSAVAQKYMVPQPSISKTIKKLETELGVRLFDRNGKKISLNGNGKYFYDKISTALSHIDDGIHHFSTAKSTIVLYTQAGSRFVSLLSADYLTTHEKVFLSTVNYSSDLKNKYDFTFMQIQEDMSDYRYEELMQDEIVAVVSVDNPLSKREEISIRELKMTKFVGYYSSMNLRAFTDRYCREQGGFNPIVIFETHDGTALRYLIEKNRGIALLPKAYFEFQPSYKLKAVPLKEKTYRSLALAWDKTKILNEYEKEFISYTKDWFQKL